MQKELHQLSSARNIKNTQNSYKNKQNILKEKFRKKKLTKKEIVTVYNN